MDINDEALLRLLRIAFGEDSNFGFSKNVDWNVVFDNSLQHGLVAVAVDGINKCRAMSQTAPFVLDLPEWEDLKYKWLGYSMCFEHDYKKQVTKVLQLARIFADNNMKMLLLKGIGLSLYYPNASYRPKGDIDIYMLGNDRGKSERADALVVKILGVKVTKSKIGHHSHFSFNDTLVENHYELSNTYFGKATSKYLEQQLQQFANADYRQQGHVCLPSPNFNALFLIWHMATHFCIEKISLRQLCDWMLFLRNEHGRIDWPLIEEIWQKAGLKQFAYVMTGLSVAYLGLDDDLAPHGERDILLKQKVMEDILHGNKRSSSVASRMIRYLTQGWKYKLATGHPWVYLIQGRLKMHLFHRDDLVEKTIFE